VKNKPGEDFYLLNIFAFNKDNILLTGSNDKTAYQLGEIKKQGLTNTIISYFGIILGFINLIIVQPFFLTTEELGLTRILYSFSVVIATFLPLGITNITIRYFPRFRDPDKKHYGYFGLMMLFPLIGFMIISIMLLVFKDRIIAQYIEQSPLFTEYFFFIIPLTLFVGLTAVLNIYCFSLFRTSFPTLLTDIIIRLLTIILVIVYSLNIFPLNTFIIMFVGIYGIHVIVLLIYVYIIDRPGWEIDKDFLKKQNPPQLIIYGLTLTVAALSSLGIRYIDSMFIGSYLSLSMVAVYSVAAIIPTIIESPLLALEKISNPKIADAWNRSSLGEIRKIYYDSSKYLFLLGGLIFTGINISINDLLELLPEDYISGLNVVYILSISTLFNMATGANNGIIFNSGHYRYGVFMLIVLIFLAVLLNIILIPLYGIAGAAIATGIANFTFNFLKFLFIKIKFKMQPFNTTSLKITGLILICIFIGLVMPVTGRNIPDIIIRSITVTVIYLVSTHYLKLVKELYDDIPIIGKKLKPRGN